MSHKKGTKLKEITRDKTFIVRLTDKEANDLEKISKRDEVSKAEVIRKGIKLQK